MIRRKKAKVLPGGQSGVSCIGTYIHNKTFSKTRMKKVPMVFGQNGSLCHPQNKSGSARNLYRRLTGSMIAPPPPPPQNGDFLNDFFTAAHCEERCYENHIIIHFLVREGLSTDDVGVARGTVLQEIRPWAGFETNRRFR